MEKKTTRQFILASKAIHGDRYDYSKTRYGSYVTKVTITCQLHGDFEQLPTVHLNGSGCQKCKLDSWRRSVVKTTQEFIDEAFSRHGNTYDYSKVSYIRGGSKVTIVCKSHGNFEQTPNSHLQGSGCPKCVVSISRVGSKWLSSIGVPDDKEHREVRVEVAGRRLVFDGFDPETNTVFEFYGDLFHGNPKIYEANEGSYLGGKTFGQLNEERLARESLILSAGYKLVTVWESDFRAEEKSKKQLKVDSISRYERTTCESIQYY